MYVFLVTDANAKHSMYIVCEQTCRTHIWVFVMKWVIVPIMGRNSILSLGDAEGRMERSGDAPRMHIQTPNIASGTCTEVATVQESLWNLIQLRSPCQLQCLTLLLGAVVTVEATGRVATQASQMCHCILLLLQKELLSGAIWCRWNPFCMG